MKKRTTLTIMVCAGIFCSAQTTYFNDTYPDAETDNYQFTNIECDTINELFEIFGVSGTSGNHQLTKKRISYNGNLVDELSVDFADTALYAGVAESFRRVENNYIASYAFGLGGVIENYDAQWNRVWRYQVANTDTSSSFFDVNIQLNDGNLLCAGVSILQYDEIIGDDAGPIELVKLSPSGDQIWRKQIYTLKEFGTPYSLHELPNGDIIITGTQAWDYDAVVLRLDSLGDLIWQHTFQSPSQEEYDDLWAQSVLLNDSTIVISYGYGYDDEFPPQPSLESSVRNLHLVKFNVDSQGIIWENEYPTIYGAQNYNNDLIQTTDMGFAFCGSLQNDLYWPLFPEGVPGFSFSYIGKSDLYGNLEWQRRYTYSTDTINFVGDQNYLYDIENTPDGGYVACGYVSDYDVNPELSAWVIKVDEFGCLEPGCQNVAVDEIRLDMQGAMTVYPNPVRSNCTIKLDLSNSKLHSLPVSTRLILTDANGRQIQNITIPPMGLQSQLEMDISGLVSGIYHAHWLDGKALLDSVQIVKE